MAKQSGIHQLRGKVGEHSYYRQTGIVPGLVRSINQGMSARVKTGAEFANTRRNNVEFAGACNVAAVLGTMVHPKYRPMILPFSQSNMSKKILEIAKATNHSWGQRVVGADDTPSLAEILTAQSKLAMGEVLSLSVSQIDGNDLVIRLGVNSDQMNTLGGLGIDGFVINYSVFNLATGKFDALTNSIRKAYSELVVTAGDDATVTEGGSVESEAEVSVPEFNFDARGWNGHQLLVAVFLPYRSINGITYTLQEYCRFQAFALERAE